MTEYLYIRNWRKFQHYRLRSPPWVKLHRELLASEDWVTLADASRLLMVVCMAIASSHEGRVPNSPAYIKRVAYLDHLPNLKPLIECGFLSTTLADDSATLADASTVQPDAMSEQSQSRTEQNRAEQKENKKSPLPPLEKNKPANGAAGKAYVWIIDDDPRWQLYAKTYADAHQGKPPPRKAGLGGMGWHFEPLTEAKP